MTKTEITFFTIRRIGVGFCAAPFLTAAFAKLGFRRLLVIISGRSLGDILKLLYKLAFFLCLRLGFVKLALKCSRKLFHFLFDILGIAVKC